MGLKILLVEDDMALAMGTRYSLETENMIVTSVDDFEKVKEEYRRQNGDFDCVLLDVMLPDTDGYEVCEWLKFQNQTLPVIFLTALDDEGNIVHGLEMGGDDYVTKPFRTRELIARIRANVRKGAYSSDENREIRAGKYLLDEKRYLLWKGADKINVTPSEFRLLKVLMMNKGHVLTREQLMDKLWSVDEAFVDDNTLSVYIRRIREKISDDAEDNPIKTVRGIGYMWRECD